MASIKQRPDGSWRARYRGPDGKEYAKHFKYKNSSATRPGVPSAQAWLDEATAAMRAGTWVDPNTSKMTMGEWLDRWEAGYAANKPGTVKSAAVHLKLIRAKFGTRQLRTIRAQDVKIWMAELAEKYARSYVYAIHRRLAQVFTDAVHDGVIARSPVSRRTSPPTPTQRPYVATTAQVWSLYDALPGSYRNLVLLGAFAGLRAGEMAALTRADVDWSAPSITVSVQHDGDELKSETSSGTIPIPAELATMMDADAGETMIVPGVFGRGVTAWRLNEVWAETRLRVDGLPEGFRIHDLRHYFASLLIAAGLDIKVVQTRMRHASPVITLRTYGHLWPDTDDTSRAAVAAVLGARKNPPDPAVSDDTPADPGGSSSDSAD
ncbi:site-specific integrase [Microbacterium sp. NPDC089190]|uniref:tyrosine-type recombinase/integrase n=1 Tax=Microbacterium sp. NPDC089190 TaxID=3155063 RepID=UPI00344DA4B5